MGCLTNSNCQWTMGCLTNCLARKSQCVSLAFQEVSSWCKGGHIWKNRCFANELVVHPATNHSLTKAGTLDLMSTNMMFTFKIPIWPRYAEMHTYATPSTSLKKEQSINTNNHQKWNQTLHWGFGSERASSSPSTPENRDMTLRLGEASRSNAKHDCAPPYKNVLRITLQDVSNGGRVPESAPSSRPPGTAGSIQSANLCWDKRLSKTQWLKSGNLSVLLSRYPPNILPP